MLADILADSSGLTNLDLSRNNMVIVIYCYCLINEQLQISGVCVCDVVSWCKIKITHVMPTQDDAAVAGIMDALRSNELMQIQVGAVAVSVWRLKLCLVCIYAI